MATKKKVQLFQWDNNQGLPAWRSHSHGDRWVPAYKRPAPEVMWKEGGGL